MNGVNIWTLLCNLLVFMIFFYMIDHQEIKKKLNLLSIFSVASINKKIVASIVLTTYLVSVVFVYFTIYNPIAALLISFLPASIPYVIYDVIVQYYTEKEEKQITELIMILSKWSLVKNDLIYCIKKACESDLKNPTKRLLHNAYIRISSGMSVEKALLQLEEDAFGDNLKYLVKNIKFAAKKGGDLSTLFKNSEEQYFKIDEELFKRKISSYRDQITIYLVMIFVLVIALWFITRDDSVYDFYVKTILGQNLIGVFCVMYCGGVILTVKK